MNRIKQKFVYSLSPTRSTSELLCVIRVMLLNISLSSDSAMAGITKKKIQPEM